MTSTKLTTIQAALLLDIRDGGVRYRDCNKQTLRGLSDRGLITLEGDYQTYRTLGDFMVVATDFNF